MVRSTPSRAKRSSPAFDAARLLTATGPAPNASRYQALIDSARNSGQQTSAILYLTSRGEDSINATAIPLKSDTGAVMAEVVVNIDAGTIVAAITKGSLEALGIKKGDKVTVMCHPQQSGEQRQDFVGSGNRGFQRR